MGTCILSKLPQYGLVGIGEKVTTVSNDLTAPEDGWVVFEMDGHASGWPKAYLNGVSIYKGAYTGSFTIPIKKGQIASHTDMYRISFHKPLF